ncbi:glutamine synthetase [Aplysia californica]|uniref:Lengsin n=1 Tax=Aplysia californica TaxID=6500 RepID=A0ABM0JH37_APLCA|nr:glutamine synthetase [Aplysia californica]
MEVADSKYKVEDFDLVQLTVTDMNGIPRGKFVPQNVARAAFRRGLEIQLFLTGIGLNGEFPLSVPELAEDNFGSGIFIPVPTTLVEIPWASSPGCRVGEVIGHILTEKGVPDEMSIRNMIEELLLKLGNMGLSFKSSISSQFKAFKQGTDYTEVLGTDKGSVLSPYGSLGAEMMMVDLCAQLGGAGVEVRTWTHGAGPGSFEVSLPTLEGLQTGDAGFRLKYGVKALMLKAGYDVTFMAQPGVPAGDNSSSVWKFSFTVCTVDGQNAFLDTFKDDKLSDLCRMWVAGMLYHGPSMTALCRPTVNCYGPSRDDRPTFPRRADWAFSSDSAFINVVRKGAAVWLELRVVSSACNPYFPLLTALASGLDGVEKAMTLPQASDPSASPFPESLSDALKVLRKNDMFRSVLSPMFVDCFCSVKEEAEIARITELREGGGTEEDVRVLERELYFRSV